MAFLYLDDSKHHRRGFSLATFVVCETDPQDELTSLIKTSGFDPATFEFKSSYSMKDNPELKILRDKLPQFILHKCELAVCIVTGDKNLGSASLHLLQKALQHKHLINSEHEIFFDEGLFSSKTAANKLAQELDGFEKCTFHFEQNSLNIAGIQIADLAAHTCATMLSETLGLIDKEVEIIDGGYPDGTMAKLGFELWARVRYNFLSKSKTDDYDDPDFAFVNVEPFGLFIHESADEVLFKAAHERFGEMYLGCIH